MDKSIIRNASTVILVREDGSEPSVLMGQRGSNAAFMPDKFVFPGGAVEESDSILVNFDDLPDVCRKRLESDTSTETAQALFGAAIRETWEETGLTIGRPNPELTLEGFAPGWEPDPSKMAYVFRAITPPGRTRRFDARFFLIQADSLDIDLDDFSQADDELRHLSWVSLEETSKLDLPFITEVVLAELKSLIGHEGSPQTVPFFDNSTDQSRFLRIS